MNLDFNLLGIALIIVHELDAIRCKEWRILPGLSLLNDKLGFLFFTYLHIPLIFWVLYEVKSGNEKIIYYFDIFLIIHLFLHLLLLVHKKNEFKDWPSWIIIIGAALCGLIDIMKG